MSQLVTQLQDINKVKTIQMGVAQSKSNEEEKHLSDKTQKVMTVMKKHRSRSRDRKHSKYSKSKSPQEKKKKKHKDHKNKHRSRSRSKSHKNKKEQNRGRSRSKDRLRNNKVQVKDSKQSSTKQLPLPLEIPMPLMPGQRRRRQRSRSPLSYYRRNQNNNEGQFWDSFSWVPRINYIPNVKSSDLVNTKKMRRLMITNVPYQIGITQDDLRNLITRFMKENYLKDEMNSCPVVNLQINETDRNVAVELSSVEETCRICKLDKIQLFRGTQNGIIRLGDSIYGNNVVTQAQNAAKAQAAAFAAINVLQNKKTNFNLNQISNAPQSSTVIRVTNAVTSYMCDHLSRQQWQQYHEDLLEGFSQYGKIVHNWLVKKNDKDICADPGNLFIEYEYKEQAQAAMSQMNGKYFDQRMIKLYYVPRDLYYKNFHKDLTPPALPFQKVQKPNIEKPK